MRIKKVHRNIPELRENGGRFRVNYGNRDDFEVLQVLVKREATQELQQFQFQAKDLPCQDSIHFNTTMKNGVLQVSWDNVTLLQTSWRIYTKEELWVHILSAVKKLQEKDTEFLDPTFDINERSVTHRLAMYLAEVFPEEDVDCEYNRIYNEDTDEYIAKNIELPIITGGLTLKDTEARTVFPDIIVHRRNTKRNLLAIEVKMAWKAGKAEFDKVKAEAYKYRLGYDYSICLILGPQHLYEVVWIE